MCVRRQYFLQGRKSSAQIQISQTLLQAGPKDMLLWKKDFHCQKKRPFHERELLSLPALENVWVEKCN